jgi:hypothetical protein
MLFSQMGRLLWHAEMISFMNEQGAVDLGSVLVVGQRNDEVDHKVANA